MMLESEKGNLRTVFDNCACCVIPCCNYFGIQVLWTVTGSASKTVGSTVEQVDFSFSLDMTFDRDDDRNAPDDPKTFRVSEGIELEEQPCELLNNGGIQLGDLDGSYLYTKRVSGIETDREEADLRAALSDIHARIDCEHESWAYAGTTHPTTGDYVPTSTVSMYAEGYWSGSGLPTLGAPNSMPTDWRSLFSINSLQFDNIVEVGADVGTDTVTNDESTPSGWDRGSLSNVASIIINSGGAMPQFKKDGEGNYILDGEGNRIITA